jgi:hypothetical protein
LWNHVDDANKDFGCKIADMAFNYYTEEDDSSKIYDFLNSGKATKAAYDKDLPFFEFYKHRPINNDFNSVTQFTNIIWKSTTNVGFAVKNNVAVLGYCTKANSAKTPWCKKDDTTCET